MKILDLIGNLLDFVIAIAIGIILTTRIAGEDLILFVLAVPFSGIVYIIIIAFQFTVEYMFTGKLNFKVSVSKQEE